MGYITQQQKKEINLKLKNLVPKAWKYTLRILDYRILEFNLRKADINLLAEHNKSYLQINTTMGGSKVLNIYFSGKVLEIFEKIHKELNIYNHNNSHIETGYIDVNYYVDINIGEFSKPFEYISQV